MLSDRLAKGFAKGLLAADWRASDPHEATRVALKPP